MNELYGLCLGLAGSIWATLEGGEFTLAWQHTVEKIRWEEDYRVTPSGLRLQGARVKGTGAGMEIPPQAVLKDGAWHYQPKPLLLQPLRLGRTPEAGDYQLCRQGHCQPLAHWIGPPQEYPAAVELWSCVSATRPPGSPF